MRLRRPGEDTIEGLAPLPYPPRGIAKRLEALEPRGWAVFARAAQQAPEPAPLATEAVVLGADDDLERQLLRHSYRIESAAHPRVHAAAARAAAALGLTSPSTIYQLEGADQPIRSLAYRPGEAVVAISGNLLALVDDEELVACFGHEFAHHRLWSDAAGRLLVTDRFLGALSVDAATPPYYLETGRRFDLATELFADRGSFVACGSLDVAVASLVKVATGLSDVDPARLPPAGPRRPRRTTAQPGLASRDGAAGVGTRAVGSGDGDGAVRVRCSRAWTSSGSISSTASGWRH